MREPAVAETAWFFLAVQSRSGVGCRIEVPARPDLVEGGSLSRLIDQHG